MVTIHKKSKNKTEKQIIGQIGENAVEKYLQNKGFEIKDRNYLRKWGELDIVAEKGNITHFIEVKSISADLSREKLSPSQNNDMYRAEDNMHPWKLKRLGRVVQTYLLDKDISHNWQFDVATVVVDQKKRLCRVSMLWDIVL